MLGASWVPSRGFCSQTFLSVWVFEFLKSWKSEFLFASTAHFDVLSVMNLPDVGQGIPVNRLPSYDGFQI